MKSLKSIGSVALTLIIVSLGTAAWAVDITGTWLGKEKCKCFNNVNGKVTERFKDEEMQITQSVTDLNILDAQKGRPAAFSVVQPPHVPKVRSGGFTPSGLAGRPF